MENIENTLRWVEGLTGGTIVASREHLRWRPQWFLDVKLPSGEVLKLLLRGWRAPGVVDTEAGSRERLKREGQVVRLLEGLPVKSPKFYGYNDDNDWILMECVAGDDQLTEVDKPERQRDLFFKYIEDMAVLHAQNPDTFELPETIMRPKDHDTNARWNYRAHRKNYQSAPHEPNPLFELAWWWLDRHEPAPRDQYSLCTGDIGANQFLFEGDEYKALFDVEMAYIGDPLQDIGLMRYRNTCYPTQLFEDVVRHYFECSGQTFDRDSLNYWTVVGLLGVSPTFARLIVSPDANIPGDMTLVWAMQGRRRAMVEAFLQIYGFAAPSRPEPPRAVESSYAKHHEFVVREIDEHFIPLSSREEAHRLKSIRAHAEIARRCAAYGPEVARLNIEDLAMLTGKQPESQIAGLGAIEQLMRDNPEKDMESRLAALYRIESRQEFLLEPAMHAVGFSSFTPLDLACAT